MQQKPSDTSTEYILGQHASEIARLDKQHLTLKRAFHKGGALLPPEVTLQPGRLSVLDVAAGTMSWSLDFIKLPEVARRREASCPDDSRIDVYACDLSLDKFPDRKATDALGIFTFQHDCTKPFPAVMRGRFDLINMKMLVLGLTHTGWAHCLKNLAEILKPGGKVHLLDVDSNFYSKEDIDLGIHRTIPRQLSKTSWITPLQELFRLTGERHGYVLDLTTRLPELVKAASLSVVKQSISPIPMGFQCRTERPISGECFKSEEAHTAVTASVFCDLLPSQAFQNGFLTHLDNGENVTTEEEKLSIARYLKTLLEERGCFLVGISLVAELPLTPL